MFYIIGLILWVLFAFLPAIVARRKGYSFVLFFILSLFTFVIALIIALLMPDKTKTAADRADEKAADKVLDEED